MRSAVVPGGEKAAIVVVWARRFWCKRCETSCTVVPEGVLPRFAYSLVAIVSAWMLATFDRLDDVAVYARQGVDRVPRVESARAGPPRWRSLGRWARSIPAWWPARPVAGRTWRKQVEGLLAGLVGPTPDRRQAVACVVGAHAGRGAGM